MRKSLSSTESAKPLTEMIKIVQGMVKSTRSLMFDLSPPVLYELGLNPAVKWLAEKTRKQHGIRVTIKDDGNDKPLTETVRLGLFRTMRELIQNVVKHAQAHTIEINIRRDGQNIHVHVKDDGVGFDLAKAKSHKHKKSGMGLFYIRERLTHLGGEIKLESKVGQGTSVTLIAPIEHKAQTL